MSSVSKIFRMIIIELLIIFQTDYTKAALLNPEKLLYLTN